MSLIKHVKPPFKMSGFVKHRMPEPSGIYQRFLNFVVNTDTYEQPPQHPLSFAFFSVADAFNVVV